MKNKAFTLIELLIVIALLGVLAVVSIAALDPFEQLKKAADTGVRNTVSEVHGAIIRYYAVKGNMPWDPLPSIGPVNLSTGYNTVGLQKIIETGELKTDFSALAGGDRLRKITVIGTKESVTVCFRPESKSFRSDPNTKYDSSGQEVGTGSNTCGQTNSDSFSCYWCVK
jgi:prepilin-type N-terminal cleavage/methylation domain-containing protein